MSVALHLPIAASGSPADPAAAILDWHAMQGRAAAWDRLAADALYPNPFHGRALLSAHAAAGLLDRRLRFVAAGRGGELLALLPFIPQGARVGMRRAHRAWLPPLFAVNGTPLVSGTHPDAADALLAGMAAAAALWRLPFCASESAAGQALAAACRRRGFAFAAIDAFDRAVLHRRPGYDAYARAHLSASRRKDLRRRLRRLEEHGAVAFTSVTAGEGLAAAVEAFLALEAAGWKGRRGTALARQGRGAVLTRALFGGGGGLDARADVLSLGGRPIAVSLALLSGGTAFLLKTAHDEALRGFAPGILLEDAILRGFLDGGFARKLDSASLPGGVLDDLLADREPTADLVIATDRALGAAALEALVRQERARQAVLRRLKRLYWRAVDAARGGHRGAA